MANQLFQKLMMIPKGMEGYSLAVTKSKAISSVVVFSIGASCVEDLLRSGFSWELKSLGVMACAIFMASFAAWFSKNPTYVLWKGNKSLWDAQSGRCVLPLKSWGGIYFFWLQQCVLYVLVNLFQATGLLFPSFFTIIGGIILLRHQKLYASLRTQWVVLALGLLVIYTLLCLGPVSLPVVSKKGLLA